MSDTVQKKSNTVIVERGTDRRIRVPLYLDSTRRRPESVVGWTARFVLVASLDAADVAAPLIDRAADDIDETAKDVIVDFTSAETFALAAGSYKWTVRVTTDTGKKYAVIEGDSDLIITECGVPSP